MDLPSIFKQLGIALGLGLLVGLQRERTDARLAGVRTFPLITVFGALSALLAGSFGGWIIGLGFIAVAAITVAGYLSHLNPEEPNHGMTTETAILAMYAVGAYTMTGPAAVAIAVGGTIAILLHLKPQLHAFAARIGDRDITAIMQFVLISLVILPVLPNEYYGPFHVLNPYRIWLMVALIVGISLGGYIIYKFFGQRVGTLVGGVLGGLISSTATTVSYSRRSRQAGNAAGTAAFVIMMASSIVFVRVLILINVAAPGLLPEAAAPIGTVFAVSALLALATWWRNRSEPSAMPEQDNPTELKAALWFAAIYSVVLIAVTAAREYFGQRGLYVVAVLSGLTDMDAITLSIAQLVGANEVAADTGWRLILVASMANLVFKGGIAAALGDRKLFGRLAVLFGVTFVVGLLIVFGWPSLLPVLAVP
jgi:uncharacterized membrane protein (DUF4010 family)